MYTHTLNRDWRHVCKYIHRDIRDLSIEKDIAIEGDIS